MYESSVPDTTVRELFEMESILKVGAAIFVGVLVWSLTGFLPLGFIAGFGAGAYLLSKQL